MSAGDIAKKLGKNKKDINRVLYQMTGIVEKAGEETPPRWKLKEGCTASERPIGASAKVDDVTTKGATPLSYDEATVKSKIIEILKTSASGQGLSTADIHRRLSDSSISMQDLKRILYKSEAEIKNLSQKNSKPMWALVSASIDNPVPCSVPMKLDGKKVYTLEEGNGTYTFKEVTSASLDKDKGPVDQSEDGDKVKLKTQSREIQDGECIAAKLEATSLEEVDEQKLSEDVLDFLKKNLDKLYTAKDIAKELGFKTRNKVLYCLEQLHDKHLINKNSDGLFGAGSLSIGNN